MPADKVITVRIPLELHTVTKSAAHKAETSLNMYCVEAIIQRLASENMLPDFPVFPEENHEPNTTAATATPDIITPAR